MPMFIVEADLVFADNSVMDGISFQVSATDEVNARMKVTIDYIMKNVSDDWGPPIRNFTVRSVTLKR